MQGLGPAAGLPHSPAKVRILGTMMMLMMVVVMVMMMVLMLTIINNKKHAGRCAQQDPDDGVNIQRRVVHWTVLWSQGRHQQRRQHTDTGNDAGNTTVSRTAVGDTLQRQSGHPDSGGCLSAVLAHLNIINRSPR